MKRDLIGRLRRAGVEVAAAESLSDEPCRSLRTLKVLQLLASPPAAELVVQNNDMKKIRHTGALGRDVLLIFNLFIWVFIYCICLLISYRNI